MVGVEGRTEVKGTQKALVFPVAEFFSFFEKHVVRIVGAINCIIPTLVRLTSIKICTTARVQTSFDPYVGLQLEAPTRAAGRR